MDKAEVVKAIERRDPERVPVWYSWFADETVARYGDALRDLMADYPDDFLIASYDMGWKPSVDRMVDEWGVHYLRSPNGVGFVSFDSALWQGWDRLDEFLEELPDPDAPGRFDHVREMRRSNPGAYIMGHWWYLFIERMVALRGASQFFLDLYVHPQQIMRLGDALVGFYLGIIDRFAEIGVDGIFFSDDWGDQRGLLISPQMWREIFKPWYKKILDAIHNGGMHAIMHSCGNIYGILPDLVEIGLDVLHPIQPQVMDAQRVVAEFRDDLSFFGGVDVQYLLPEGTVEEVEEGLERVIDLLDGPHGGFLAAPANSIMPETPMENIEAMCRTLKEYGQR